MYSALFVSAMWVVDDKINLVLLVGTHGIAVVVLIANPFEPLLNYRFFQHAILLFYYSY